MSILNGLDTKLKEARANMALLQARTGPYTNVPQYIYYKNGGSLLFSVNSPVGEGFVFIPHGHQMGERLLLQAYTSASYGCRFSAFYIF